MVGRVLVLVAALAACGDDDGGNNTRVDANGGSDSGGADSPGGAGFLSGTSCTGPVTYELTGDERIVVYTSAEGAVLEAITVLDGQIFDTEDEAAWQTYAQTADTLVVFAFTGSPPVATQTITSIFDSFAAGRGLGVLGFSEGGDGEMIQITALDTTAKTISVTFTVPVHASTTVYPPGFDTVVECETPTPGSVTGSFSGMYEPMVL